MQSKGSGWLYSRQAALVLPLVALLVLLVVWEAVVALRPALRLYLPAPTQVMAVFWQAGDVMAIRSRRPLMTTMIGFLLSVVTGVGLGFLIGYSRLAYVVLYPLLVGFNTIPKVALVPLLALWFGIGTVPAILTAFLLAFFPIAVNVAVGLETVEPEMKDVLKSLGASQWEIFVKVGFPHTLPYLFASLKIAISTAFIGSVISETVASNRGLGFLIVSASSTFDVPLAYAGLVVLAVMGIALYGLAVVAERAMIPWARS
ncbi:MAG: ABC transporter permease [Thermostichales cyanobacterium DRC_bins_46]